MDRAWKVGTGTRCPRQGTESVGHGRTGPLKSEKGFDYLLRAIGSH